MITIEQLTPHAIDQMSYNELIGITRETNRPPGGLESIKLISRESNITPEHKILEIGTSTGFTAINLARLTKANILGIDINQYSLDEAKQRSKSMGVESKTQFELNDATNLTYPNSTFDMVFCGNVTSYVPNRLKALSEYTRVLKEGGVIAAIPMYYLKEPSKNLLNRVSEAIKYNISPEYKKDWLDFFNKPELSCFFSEDYKFDSIDEEKIIEFSKNIVSRPHLNAMRKDTKKRLTDKYIQQIKLFGENLSIMGYTIMLLRKEEFKLDPELFTSTRIS